MELGTGLNRRLTVYEKAMPYERAKQAGRISARPFSSRPSGFLGFLGFLRLLPLLACAFLLHRGQGHGVVGGVRDGGDLGQFRLVLGVDRGPALPDVLIQRALRRGPVPQVGPAFPFLFLGKVHPTAVGRLVEFLAFFEFPQGLPVFLLLVEGLAPVVGRVGPADDLKIGHVVGDDQGSQDQQGVLDHGLLVPGDRLSFSHERGLLLELFEEPRVILVKRPDVVHPVLEHRGPFHAHPKSEAGPAFGVDLTVLQHVGVDHAAPKGFDPA